MKYLLDTNVCIRYVNGKSESIRDKLMELNREQVMLCSIVKAELLFGLLKASPSHRSIQSMNLFLSTFDSLPFDDQAANEYAHIRAGLERKGAPIGPNDLMIASIAYAHHLTLVTHNTREFGRIENLQVEDWEESS